ncbi:MAG: DUF1292 domain-containing protein [Oscillospiraceae bacterium]|jgi:uncharacterized protein YrzB (UPF0473 family)|nr:DUF1292 domain-containing protein [Oscillospiraceae bacterium]
MPKHKDDIREDVNHPAKSADLSGNPVKAARAVTPIDAQGSAQDGEEDFVELIGEDGEAHEFEHLLTFEHKGETYVALGYDSEEDEEVQEVMLLKIVKDEKSGEDLYSGDIDDALYAEISQKALGMLE